jgi:hypothetical protein
MVAVSARAASRVRHICDEHDDALGLRVALIEELRRAVPFDAHAWLLTDPETEVGCAPLADVPWVRDLPRQIRLKYLTSVNRWTHLDRPVGLLRMSTSDHRDQSLVWRELLSGHGVGDAASVVFRDQFGCWAFLELWRIGRDARFAQADASFLTEVSGVITHALRRCQAHMFDVPVSNEVVRDGPAVLVLSPDLVVNAQTPATERYLRLLVPPAPGQHPIPAGAYNVAAQLLAVEAGVDDHAPSARVHLSGGVWLTLRASRIGDSTRGAHRDVAVTIESTSAAERLALYIRTCGSALARRSCSHTSRRARTHARSRAQWWCRSTRFQDHLKSIFAKCRVNNRRTLLTRALGR